MEELVKEGSITYEYQRWMENLAAQRDKTAKKDFNGFAQNNECMKAILRYSKSVFDKYGDCLLKGKMKKTVEKILIN